MGSGRMFRGNTLIQCCVIGIRTGIKEYQQHVISS